MLAIPLLLGLTCFQAYAEKADIDLKKIKANIILFLIIDLTYFYSIQKQEQ